MAVGHVLLLVCMFGLSRGQLLEWTAKDYPNPQTDPELCGRKAGTPSYVCDPNKLLKPIDAEILDHYLVNMPNITKCPCSTFSCELGGPNRGYKLAVALVKKLKRPENMPETVDGKMGLTRTFAFNLLHKYWTWGTCNELSIIVFSQDDGILMTFTGNTTGMVLKDSVTYAVQSELARFFQNKDNVGQGLHYVSLNYRKVLDGEPVFPITYSEVGSTATMVKVSIVTSLITTLLLRIFC